MRPINLNALRVFAIVARHESLQRAADEINLSRGAVSLRIRQLELDLGAVLFVRETRGVSLTPEGARCRAAVDEALATLETALADLGRAGDRITLHLGASTAAKWLMPRMDAFNVQFPHVSLRTEVHDAVLARSLGRGEIAIWPGKDPGPSVRHHTRHLSEIRLAAVCSPNFVLPDGPIGLETLLTLPLLQDAHRRWERLIEASGHRAAHAMLNFDRSALALDAAANGHGVAIAPTYMLKADLRAHRLVELWIPPDAPGEHLFVSWSREHAGQRDVERVVGWLLSQFERNRRDGAGAARTDP